MIKKNVSVLVQNGLSFHLKAKILWKLSCEPKCWERPCAVLCSWIQLYAFIVSKSETFHESESIIYVFVDAVSIKKACWNQCEGNLWQQRNEEVVSERERNPICETYLQWVAAVDQTSHLFKSPPWRSAVHAWLNRSNKIKLHRI